VTDTAQPSRPRGRAAEKSLATRSSLLELAADLFAERGYIQTSMRDIARAASVTTGAVYGHFRNKADLLVEAISDRTAAEFANQPATTAEEFRADLTASVADFSKRRRLRALIVQGAAAAQTDAETRDRLREEQLYYINYWTKGWKRYRDRLGIDPSVDVETAVLFTWAAELGLGVLEGVGIEPRSKKAWADAFDRFVGTLQLSSDQPPPAPPPKQSRKRASAPGSPTGPEDV
jgi:AcrR family transcriptional regulator